MPTQVIDLRAATEGVQAQIADLLDSLPLEASPAGAAPRLEFDPDKIEKQMVKLVLIIAELLRRLMESQALHRMERGALTDPQIDALGEALYRAKATIEQLRSQFGLQDEELNLNLGPLGKLL
jgi:hypothetical protein